MPLALHAACCHDDETKQSRGTGEELLYEIAPNGINNNKNISLKLLTLSKQIKK